eukprot:336651-Amphidinium_carterae.1
MHSSQHTALKSKSVIIKPCFIWVILLGSTLQQSLLGVGTGSVPQSFLTDNLNRSLAGKVGSLCSALSSTSVRLRTIITRFQDCERIPLVRTDRPICSILCSSSGIGLHNILKKFRQDSWMHKGWLFTVNRGLPESVWQAAELVSRRWIW